MFVSLVRLFSVLQVKISWESNCPTPVEGPVKTARSGLDRASVPNESVHVCHSCGLLGASNEFSDSRKRTQYSQQTSSMSTQSSLPHTGSVSIETLRLPRPIQQRCVKRSVLVQVNRWNFSPVTCCRTSSAAARFLVPLLVQLHNARRIQCEPDLSSQWTEWGLARAIQRDAEWGEGRVARHTREDSGLNRGRDVILSHRPKPNGNSRTSDKGNLYFFELTGFRS